MMIYAQIKSDVVVNCIVVDENTPMELFSRGFDYFLRIDNLETVPGMGWGYDGAHFIAPPDQAEQEPQE